MDKIRLRGAKFVLTDGCGNEIACGITNECGEIVFKELPLGKYFIKEIEAPCGYNRCDKAVEVELNCCDSNKCVEVVNRREAGSIKIIKFGI